MGLPAVRKSGGRPLRARPHSPGGLVRPRPSKSLVPRWSRLNAASDVEGRTRRRGSYVEGGLCAETKAARRRLRHRRPSTLLGSKCEPFRSTLDRPRPAQGRRQQQSVPSSPGVGEITVDKRWIIPKSRVARGPGSNPRVVRVEERHQDLFPHWWTELWRETLHKPSKPFTLPRLPSRTPSPQREQAGRARTRNKDP